MKFIDLRSDTVTHPTDKMREAMMNAIVGDDVYGDDPTVIELEELGAKLLNKEAALFVPSGTFGNQLAVLTHTKRGDEVILEANCHILMHEVGASATIAGVQLRPIEGDKGEMNPEKVRRYIREDDIHFPETGLICLENAHSCGKVISLDNMMKISDIAKEHNIPVHLDGARLFNAATALGVDARELAKYADTVMFCLSKGLAAPVGSLLLGSKDFINKARKNRKLMGGALRQVGVLAAPGIIALEEMIGRLKEDHDNAEYLTEELEKIDGIDVIKDRRDINMVFFTLPSGIIEEEVLINKLKSNNIIINGIEDGEYRFVTNIGVTREDIDKVIRIMKENI